MKERLDAWLFGVLLLIAAGCAGYFTSRYVVRSDWTAGARASLAAPSRAILKKLRGPVQVVSYASPGGGLRPTIAAFIRRYARLKPDLSLRFVDPQTDPARMRKKGISVDGELIVHYKGRQERLDELSESSFTNALTRLARGGDRIVAFVTGDGERNAAGRANADMGTFMRQLEQRGMRAVPLNFAQVDAVPQETDLVVLASPLARLSAGAVKALVDYVATGGNLLWLTEPDSGNLGLEPLAKALSIQKLPGMLVDPSGAKLGVDDPRMLAEARYPPQTITHGFVMTTLFPQVAALAITSKRDWHAQAILRSSAQSHDVRTADSQAPLPDAAAVNGIPGPLDFGFALTRLSPSPRHNQQRVVVIGDGDFLSNSYLGNGGNRALGQRLFDWLLGDDALVDMPARHAPDRILRLPQAGLDILTGVFLIAIPLLLLLTGVGIAWRRRRR